MMTGNFYAVKKLGVKSALPDFCRDVMHLGKVVEIKLDANTDSSNTSKQVFWDFDGLTYLQFTVPSSAPKNDSYDKLRPFTSNSYMCDVDRHKLTRLTLFTGFDQLLDDIDSCFHIFFEQPPNSDGTPGQRGIERCSDIRGPFLTVQQLRQLFMATEFCGNFDKGQTLVTELPRLVTACQQQQLLYSDWGRPLVTSDIGYCNSDSTYRLIYFDPGRFEPEYPRYWGSASSPE